MLQNENSGDMRVAFVDFCSVCYITAVFTEVTAVHKNLRNGDKLLLLL